MQLILFSYFSALILSISKNDVLRKYVVLNILSSFDPKSMYYPMWLVAPSNRIEEIERSARLIYKWTIWLKQPWCAFLHAARSSGKGYEALGIWQHKYKWNDASICFVSFVDMSLLAFVDITKTFLYQDLSFKVF